MELRDGSSVVADLTTIGRKSGKPRTVELRLLYWSGKFYATSSRVQGKHWCQNLIKNPEVVLNVRGKKLPCLAAQITNEHLRRQILTLRDTPPQLDRVVFEIEPRG
ncbi:MAG: nitroreductase/quinone reductase family protein [Chloroflexota bacterium]|jgi:deazaflavin-dependent oxidoreductase (nitroreductase family)